VTDREREEALERFGYTRIQAAFLARVVLYGGYFLRRQYAAFNERGHGRAATRFLRAAVDRGHARTHTIGRLEQLFHLYARPIYAALDQKDNGHRRPAEWAAVVRRLMTLDFVLAHPDAAFIATEADKVAFARNTAQVPDFCWPSKTYPARRAGRALTRRPFVDKMPWYRLPTSPRLWLTYVDAGETLAGFETFLAKYRAFLRASPSGVTYVSRTWDARPERTFQRIVTGAHAAGVPPTGVWRVEALIDFYQLRQKFEAKDYRGIQVADIHRFWDLRNDFAATAYDTLYHRWLADGDAAVVGVPGPDAGRDCVFRAHRLPFSYGHDGSGAPQPHGR